MKLLIISYIVILLSAFLTVFSIFFNYDEEKASKISKYGWIAIFTTFILTGLNLGVKYIETNIQKKKSAKTDSLQTELILKNEQVAEILKDFESSSISNFNNINEKISTNLDELDNTNNQIQLILKSLGKTEKQINNQIYESTFPLGQSINCLIQFRLPYTKEIGNHISEYIEANNRTEVNLDKLENLENNSMLIMPIDISGMLLERIFTSFVIYENNTNSGFIEGHSSAINYYINYGNEQYIYINAHFELEIKSSKSLVNIFDICKKTTKGAVSYFCETEKQCKYFDLIEIHRITLKKYGRELIIEAKHNNTKNAINPTKYLRPNLLNKEGYRAVGRIDFEPKFNRCWDILEN